MSISPRIGRGESAVWWSGERSGTKPLGTFSIFSSVAISILLGKTMVNSSAEAVGLLPPLAICFGRILLTLVSVTPLSLEPAFGLIGLSGADDRVPTAIAVAGLDGCFRSGA